MAGVQRISTDAIEVDVSVPDSKLTRDQIIARNMRVVEAHFHNENPDTVEKAIELYNKKKIVWEAPTRGVVMDNSDDILKAYRGIFRTVAYKSYIPIRRFATEKYVFDDQIAHIKIVGDEMENLPYPKGAELSVRLAHVFELEDGKIVREIAYEMWREEGTVCAVDHIPEGAKELRFDSPADAPTK